MNGSAPPPNEPMGNDQFTNWCRNLLRYVKSLELKGCYNGFVDRSTLGTFVRAQPGKGSTSESAAREIFYYQYSMGDYIWCTDIRSPFPNGSIPVYTPVAKNPKLRNSIATETIDGILVSYSYSAYTVDGQKYLRRDSSIPGNSVIEKQDINPRFILNDEIQAEKVKGGARINTTASDPANTVLGIAQAIEYTDTNPDARAWTQRDDQST